MIPKTSEPKLIKYRAAFRIVVFVIFLGMAFWFSPHKAIYLTLPIGIALAISIFQFRTRSNVNELLQALVQLKGLKKIVILSLLGILMLLSFYSLWTLFRLAE